MTFLSPWGDAQCDTFSREDRKDCFKSYSPNVRRNYVALA